jgi:hypothetical protein
MLSCPGAYDATNAFGVHRKAIADFGSKATSSEIVAEFATLAARRRLRADLILRQRPRLHLPDISPPGLAECS